MGVLLLRVWIYPSLTLTLKVCDAKHDIEPPILTFHRRGQPTEITQGKCHVKV